MKKTVESKREREKEVVALMIALYCRKNHREYHREYSKENSKGYEGKECLCEECKELAEYAAMRSDKCPFMESKTFCSNCKVHCYKPMMREKIRKVMRFSGPRMIFYHPVMAIRHVIESKKEKKCMETN